MIRTSPSSHDQAQLFMSRPLSDMSGWPKPDGPQWFATTHWSVVLSAAEQHNADAAAALEQICRAYWFPLYAYVRRRGSSPEDAQDLTQGFFASLLEKDRLTSVSREKGRFR